MGSTKAAGWADPEDWPMSAAADLVAYYEVDLSSVEDSSFLVMKCLNHCLKPSGDRGDQEASTPASCPGRVWARLPISSDPLTIFVVGFQVVCDFGLCGNP